MTEQQLDDLGPALADFLDRYLFCCGYTQTFAPLQVYCRGLLSDLPRKSVEPMALAAGVPVRTLQEFLRDHQWNQREYGCGRAMSLGDLFQEVRRLPRASEGVNTMAKKASKKSAKVAREAAPKRVAAKPVKLLSGGNPQIAKATGDAPVQAYIEAMPGWKRDVGRRLDALIVRTVPDVYKAVKWNSPLYGIEGQGWFLGIHCFTRYIKVAFFRGAALQPVPPGESKQKEVRYLDIHEDDPLDEAQVAAWVKQASQLPGEHM